MKSRVVDLNADVRAIRRLRAAAVFPQLSALCCVVIALLFVALEEDGLVTAFSLLTGAVLLIALARGTERGAPWALGFLTAVLTAMTGVAVVTMWIEPASMLERAQFAAGALLMLMPCWILVSLGWTARGHRAIVSAVHDLSRGAWNQIPREHRSREARISFAIATLLYAAGLVPAGLAVAAVGGHLWVVGLVYAPIAAVAGRMWTRGRRQSAFGVQEVRRLDARSPVLLLRSFVDDNLPLEKRYRLFSFLFTAREALTLESFVVDQMWRWGPVLAIGKPSEHLSPLGAAREYIPED